MIITVLITLVLIGFAAWGAIEYLRYRQRRAGVARTVRADELARIAADPADFIAAFRRRATVRRAELEQAVSAANQELLRIQGKLSRLLQSFSNGTPPSSRTVVFVAMLCIVWVIAAVGQFLIDYPIILSVSGGNVVMALVGTLISVLVPVCASIVLAVIWHNRKSPNALQPFQFRAAVAANLIVVACVIGIMMILAPIRASIEWSPQIEDAKHQLTQYVADGDTTGENFAQVKIDSLTTSQKQSADFNQALVLIASLVELTSGFAVPIGILILRHRSLDAEETAAKRAVVKAENARTNQAQREIQELSRVLMEANVPQAAIDQALIRVQQPPSAGGGPEPIALDPPARPVRPTSAAPTRPPSRPMPGTARPSSQPPAVPQPRPSRAGDQSTPSPGVDFQQFDQS